MAANKTTFTAASVSDYLEARGNEQQVADGKQLIRMLRRLTGHPPRMWGPSIVGFGVWRYQYASGHRGEAPLAGFAIRGRDMVIYVMPETDEEQALLRTLGRHRMGKSCLYFKQLADLDPTSLEQLIASSVARLRQRDNAGER